MRQAPGTDVFMTTRLAPGVSPVRVGTGNVAAHPDVRPAVRWLVGRAWPICVTLLLVAIGMAYSLCWGSLVHHSSYWVTPGDLWGTYFAAHFVQWGYLGGVYTAGGGLVSFPGITVVLAPCAWFTGLLHLSSSYPKMLPHPTAWLVLGPYEILVSSTALFALDRLVRDLGVVSWRRGALCFLQGVLLFGVSVIWGHPEDALAVALVTWALCAALRDRFAAAGWLAGIAVAVQPLVVLALPVLVLRFPPRRWGALALRIALPALALLATPLISNFTPTWRAITVQPNFPGIDHPTPWLVFARRLPPIAAHHVTVIKRVGGRFVSTTTRAVGQSVVAAGPLRSAAVVMAGVIALMAWWRKRAWFTSPLNAIWLVTLAFALRIFFEPVMDPYYMWPPLAIAVVLAAAKRSPSRLAVVGVLSIALSAFAYWHVSPWIYWTPLVVGLGVILVATLPTRPRASSDLGGTVAENVHEPLEGAVAR